ncbi:MAG: alginate lyase family protein [Acidimicrobiales bacterium]|nr:alginate lyase family protein [Acidimicrobiales bacterium]
MSVLARSARLAPVFCVIDDRHRELEVADDAVAGRYHHGGITLDLGRRPDWIGGGLADDEEWRIEWVKLYEGLDLGHAFAVTGDQAYLDTWQDLVEAFCDQVPVGHDTSDVSARRIQNWIYAWQRFADADGYPGLRPGLAERLVERLAADTAHLGEHLTPERNHRTLELYTLLLVGIATGDGALAERGLSLLADNARTDIWDDGVHRECSSDYHLIVLRSLLGAIASARSAGLDVPADLVERADLACTFGMHLQRPDGTTPALSDGDQADFRSLLLLGAELLDRPDLAWVASGGTQGTPPTERHATFAVGGYVTQRSGWGEGARSVADERWSVLDCGPLGDGGHGHYDHLSLELAGGGHRLVVDPGRYTYADDADGWRQWFKGTAAHNTVCIDGLDHVPYRRGKPKGERSCARLVSRHTSSGLDVVVAEAWSPRYSALHTRTVAFVDDDYWIVHDVITDSAPRACTARWHLDPEAWHRTELRLGDDQATVRAPGLTLAVPALDVGVCIEDGWVSPTYGVKHRAPVVRLGATARCVTHLATVLVPGRVDLRVRAVAPADPGGPMTVYAAHRGALDVVHLTTGADPTWERRPC